MTVVVVAAVIRDGERFLVTRRPDGVHLAGLWEFPGGKVHDGESHAAALAREIREELDTDVEVGALILSNSHAYPERTVALHFYACLLRGAPRPLLGQEMRWETGAGLRQLSFPPADEALLDRLVGGRP